MLLSFLLLFFLCESTVTTTWHPTSISASTVTTTVAAEANLSSLQLVATPNYPVAAGQRVNLHCSAITVPNSIMWSWLRLENQTWQKVGSGRDLTLTEPEQSGLYHCHAHSQLTQRNVTSPLHTVFIISMHATVGDHLGIAAFFLSLLALIINFAILVWLGWQRHGATLTTSKPATKGFPGPEKLPKRGLPQTESDGEVYMNYTNTSQAYTDLDPTNVNVHNVYSSLS